MLCSRDNSEKPKVPSHNSLNVDNSVGPTHYSYKSRVIPVLWLSFVCKRGVGEVGHLVRDFEVVLCPFPLGNKSCPVEWTKKKLRLKKGENFIQILILFSDARKSYFPLRPEFQNTESVYCKSLQLNELTLDLCPPRQNYRGRLSPRYRHAQRG